MEETLGTLRCTGTICNLLMREERKERKKGVKVKEEEGDESAKVSVAERGKGK